MAKSKRSAAKTFKIYEAAWRLAPDRMRAVALEQRNRAPPKAQIKRFPQIDETAIRALEAAGDALQQLLHQKQDLHEPTSDMRKWLVQRLSEGKFAASGVRSVPPGELEFKPIPADFFKGHPNVDWRKGIVENFGQRYEAVEVGKGGKPPPKSPSLKRKAGRPRKAERVDEVVVELEATGRFRGLREKKIVELVQEECRTRYPALFAKDSPSATSVREAMRRLREIHH